MTSLRCRPTRERPLSVAVVGAGPAGFHAALALLAQDQLAVEVDVFDRLPTPYGLVRGGVAPDHPKIKTVAKVYERAALDPRFSFFGNVELGRDIDANDLVELYDQVVYALGNENDRRMGIPGEHFVGCTPATVLVGWYNGHPDYTHAHFDLSRRRVAVIGNGNVAADVARILARSPEELRRTDIADHALFALERSQIEEIIVLGRRGPLQAAFSPAELRELVGLAGVRVRIEEKDLALSGEDQAELETLRSKDPRRRMYETLGQILDRRGSTRPDDSASRTIHLRFRVSPVEILGDRRGRIRALRIEKNRLVRDHEGSVRAVATGETEDLDVGWVFVSIGYEGRPIAGVPYDADRGVIANVDGRVTDPLTRAPIPNQYCVGWARSGAKGLIAMHRAASAEVVTRMLEDIADSGVDETPRGGRTAMTRRLGVRGVRFVTFDEWRLIDEAEIERGRARGAPRSKFVEIPQMIDAVEMKRRGW